MNIAFIGLGIMGSRMAANLLKSDHALYVYNRTVSRSEELVVKGAEMYRDIREIGNADIVFTMLTTPEVVREVAAGNNGFLQHLKKGTLWVDCSTVNPSFTKDMADRAMKSGIRFMDAPVAGSLGPAERGELIFMAGGDIDDLQVIQPLLDLMGKKTFHTGSVGTGASLKMIVNLVMGHAMAGFAEGLALSRAMGIDQGLVLDTLLSTPAVAPVVAGKRRKIEEGDFSPEFPLQWMHKDLHLAIETAYELNLPMPATHAVKEVFSAAKSRGLGELDISAVIRAL